MSIPIRFRNGTPSEREGYVLAEGEPGWDGHGLYVGDGTTPGGIAVGGSGGGSTGALTFTLSDGTHKTISLDSTRGLPVTLSDGSTSYAGIS